MYQKKEESTNEYCKLLSTTFQLKFTTQNWNRERDDNTTKAKRLVKVTQGSKVPLGVTVRSVFGNGEFLNWRTTSCSKQRMSKKTTRRGTGN